MEPVLLNALLLLLSVLDNVLHVTPHAKVVTSTHITALLVVFLHQSRIFWSPTVVLEAA